MFSILTVAILSAPAPAQEVLPFAWNRVQRVHVDVREVKRKIALEYGIDVRVYPDGDGEGLVLRRIAFEPKSIAGKQFPKEALSEEARAPFREWLAQMEHTPSLRVDAAGVFEEFSGTKRAADEMFAQLTAGANKLELRAAELRYKNQAYLAEWVAPLRSDWVHWSESWTGLPGEPGSYTQQRRVYVGLPDLEWLDTTAEIEVGEPFELDGRTLLRIESKSFLVAQQFGRKVTQFLQSMGANPGEFSNLEGFETEYLETALLDTTTWLPVSVHTKATTTLHMETSRANWREQTLEEHRYEFDWVLNESD